LAELALAYSGAVQYETLKSYPNREILILTETMNTINKRKDAALKSKSSGMGMGGPPIGEF
jgi:hypothetical protein